MTRSAVFLEALVLVTLVLTAAPPGRAADSRLKTVIVDLESRRGFDAELAHALTDVVQGVFSKDAGRLVLGRSDIAQVMQLEADKQATGCNAASCLGEIASALDADRLVTGSISKVGTTYFLVLSEIDAKKLEPIARVEAQLPQDESQLIDGVRRAATDLFNQAAQHGGASGVTGGLLVRTSPPGAQVSVGGRIYGPAPQTVDGLPSGTQRVLLQAEGKPPVAFDVVVPTGARSTVDVEVAQPGAPATPEQVKQHDDAVGWNGVVGWSKLVGGGACCALGAITGCMGGIALAASGGDPTTLTGGLSFLGCGALMGLPGAAVAGWGGFDLFNPPGMPGEGGLANHVTVTPADGPVTSFEVPVGQVMQH